MTQEELQKLIDKKIQLGHSYQQIYDELNAAIPGRELDLAGLIAELPSMTQRKRFDPWRKLLLGITGLGVLLQMFLAYLSFGWGTYFIFTIELIGIGGFVFLSTLVARWRSTGYKVLGYAALALLAFEFPEIKIEEIAVLFWIRVALYGMICALGLILYRQLGGKYTKTFHGRVQGEEGIMAQYTIKFTNQ